MEKISKQNFGHLLEDLYDIFNPEHKSYVPGLVDRNIDVPLDSVDMILFKYNQDHLDFYDPQMNSQDYQMSLIAQYAKGSRPLQELDIAKRRAEIQEQKQAASQQQQQEQTQKEEELRKQLQSQTAGIEKKTQEEINSMKEEMKKALQEIQRIRDEAKKNPEDDGVDYNIRCNYTAEEIQLPNAKKLAGLGIGARIIAKTTQGRPIGLIVKDITYDDFSHPDGRTIIDIILDKG